MRKRTSAIALPGGSVRAAGPRQNASWVGRLYGLPEARQTGYLCAAATCGGRWSAVGTSGAPILLANARQRPESARLAGTRLARTSVPPSIHFLPREP